MSSRFPEGEETLRPPQSGLRRLDEPLHSRWEFSRKWEKEWHGETSLSRNWSVPLFFRSAFILWVIHRDKWKIQSHVGSAVLTLIETTFFFLHFFRYTKFLGDLHHLLAKRPVNILWPFLMMISQPENLFFPKVTFLKSGTTLRRHQINLHSYRAKVQWAIIKKRIYLA